MNGRVKGRMAEALGGVGAGAIRAFILRPKTLASADMGAIA
jgi:hypothetical protein